MIPSTIYDPYSVIPVVIPSGMVLYTDLVPTLIKRNPRLAKQVIAGINRVDRNRRDLYRFVMGETK